MKLMFLHPVDYGRKAEELLWRKVYYEVIQVIKTNKKVTGHEAVEKCLSAYVSKPVYLLLAALTTRLLFTCVHVMSQKNQTPKGLTFVLCSTVGPTVNLPDFTFIKSSRVISCYYENSHSLN